MAFVRFVVAKVSAVGRADKIRARSGATPNWRFSLFYGWSETSACAYLDTIMTSDEMDALVAVKGARSKCARGKLRDLPQVPVLDRPLP